MKPSFSLSGRVAVVTGSGRNIGRAIALEFARAGATVIVNGHRDRGAVDETVRQIVGAGGKACAVMSDVAEEAAVYALICEGASLAGAAIDIVVANVGMRRSRPFLEVTLEEWNATLAVNLTGVFHLAQATLPAMIARGHGRFICLSGLPAYTGRYAHKVPALASKTALQGLTKGIADEFGACGITANLVAPGMVRTERDWTQYRHNSEAAARASIPAGRLARVDDVAAACLYLASDEAAFVNGQTLHINGGQVMY